MRSGEIARGWAGWLCRIKSCGPRGSHIYSVVWITGPLAKRGPRPARIYDPKLVRAARCLD